MSKPKPQKRVLKFHDLDDLLREIRSLHSAGYVGHGNWNLSQILGHLNDWTRFPMDGFPIAPLPIRMMFWVMRKTIGPGMKRKVLEQGFSNGLPTAPQTVPLPDALSDTAAIEKFEHTIERLRNFQGSIYPSPLFGALDRKLAITVSLLHAEHHLGFLEPRR